MFNYQGLLNPSQFPQQQMAPQGASYWMQYAQPPQPLNLPPQAAGGNPTAPGTPPQPPVPGVPPRGPATPAHGGDTGFNPHRPGGPFGQPGGSGQPQGQPQGGFGQSPARTMKPFGFNTAMPTNSRDYPTNIGGYDVNGPIPRGLANNIFNYYGSMVDHDRFMTERMGQGANTAYYKNWLPRQYWDMARRMHFYEPNNQKQGWNTIRDARGDNPQADILPGGRR
jgi:hypothetical protein